jgi:hypothetical protein
VEQPAGLRYEPDLLTAVTAYDFDQVVMHGQVAKRTVCHFGVGYEYDSARTAPGRPLPTELVGLRTAWPGQLSPAADPPLTSAPAPPRWACGASLQTRSTARCTRRPRGGRRR